MLCIIMFIEFRVPCISIHLNSTWPWAFRLKFWPEHYMSRVSERVLFEKKDVWTLACRPTQNFDLPLSGEHRVLACPAIFENLNSIVGFKGCANVTGALSKNTQCQKMWATLFSIFQDQSDCRGLCVPTFPGTHRILCMMGSQIFNISGNTEDAGNFAFPNMICGATRSKLNMYLCWFWFSFNW